MASACTQQTHAQRRPPWASLEGNESETRVGTPHAAWLSESSKSRASIQFIREPLAAALV